MMKTIGLGAAALLSPLVANAAESMMKYESYYSVQETADRFESIAKEKGLNIFARIDHQKNAENVDLELRPTQLIIFGNPTIGTKLMQCSQSMGIDLPLKVLVTEDEDQKVWLSYQSPLYLKELHDVKGCDAVFDKVSGVLNALASASASK